jgi:RNA polymerase sigma-70 factor (ECF subfamily)
MDGDPPRDASDDSLLARVQAGSQHAAGELYARYARRLLGLARAKCGADLAGRVEAEDIVQSVFGSFFRGVQVGGYTTPDGEELWGLLLVITLNKVRAKGAHHRAAKRDVRRTVSGDELAVGGYDPPADDTAAAALLGLVVEEVLAALPAGHRPVVRLRIEGHEVAEIAAATGRSKRTVERVLQEFRGRMAAVYGPDQGGGDGGTGG